MDSLTVEAAPVAGWSTVNAKPTGGYIDSHEESKQNDERHGYFLS